MASRPDFNMLYQEHYSRVFGLCRRLLNSVSLAEDATQDAFMKAWNNFSRYDAKQPFWQWIATIANNTCIDLLRKRKREKYLFDLDADEEDSAAMESQSTPETLDQMISSEQSDLLTQAVDRLPEKYRIPLVMAYYNETSYEDIAVALDITISHVGVLLLRAKKQLRAHVEEITSAMADNESLL